MRSWIYLLILGLVACTPPATNHGTKAAGKPAVLLITLDTSRADYFGKDTPGFMDFAQKGILFTQAYATAPITLPAHTSMMTGMYPAEHGIHENARFLSPDKPVLAQALQQKGWFTSAVVSAYPLSADFGLHRGFTVYHDDLPEDTAQRDGRATNAIALGLMDQAGDRPFFLWTHYFDPHTPYAAPKAYADQYPDDPYKAEIAYTDDNLTALIQAFVQKVGDRPFLILIVGDHGESLGEKGEAQHGNLLYQGAMHVPMAMVGTMVPSRVEDKPVSIRDVYGTVRQFAGLSAERTLLQPTDEVVLGEAMKPYLQYGWSPQVMAVAGQNKFIRSATLEIYDLKKDPDEEKNLGNSVKPEQAVLKALARYPVPGAPKEAVNLTQEQMEQLSSLGYSGAVGMTGNRQTMPAPANMTHLFDLLDRGSDAFVRADYRGALTLFGKVLEGDPENLAVLVRMAVAHSLLGDREQALAFFRRAGALNENSVDLRHYLGMHYVRFQEWDKAADQFSFVLKHMPQRRTALIQLGEIRLKAGAHSEALALFERALAVKEVPDLRLRCAKLAMMNRESARAVDHFEQARNAMPTDFPAYLDMGVCYLDLGRKADAAAAFEQVSPQDRRYPMALFKRAQVAVLLGAPDAPSWIDRARIHADEVTRPLIARERLFEGK